MRRVPAAIDIEKMEWPTAEAILATFLGRNQLFACTRGLTIWKPTSNAVPVGKSVSTNITMANGSMALKAFLLAHRFAVSAV
jgi:hypothetical protein